MQVLCTAMLFMPSDGAKLLQPQPHEYVFPGSRRRRVLPLPVAGAEVHLGALPDCQLLVSYDSLRLVVTLGC